MKLTLLRDIAEIRMGYTFRGSLKLARSGNTAAIQMKDASQDGILLPQNFARFTVENLPEHYLLLPGDLIFRARGLLNNTILISRTMPGTICIAPLMVIRMRPDQDVLPAYLHWFINLSSTQQKMNSYARGTTIRMIPAGAMERLEVVVPTPERQKKIVTIAELDRQSQALEFELATKRQIHTEELLLRYAYGIRR